MHNVTELVVETEELSQQAEEEPPGRARAQCMRCLAPCPDLGRCACRGVG